MAIEFIRFRVDGAVPKADYDALSTATKIAIRDRFLQLKTLCKKINEGKGNEEPTITFKWHICRHEFGDTNCVEQDI